MAKKKKTRLSKVEKFFVEKNSGMGLEWIMDNLGDGYSETTIKNILEKQKRPPVDHFARTNGVVMMTEEQSCENNDYHTPTHTKPNHIHTITD